MVSQHPDHAGIPYWHNQAFISTQYEAEECFLSFSELGSSEYKWDWEGKLVDESVMERLLSTHYDFFKKNQLGKDKFLTFRLPNPTVETEFRLGRAFMGILSSTSMASKFGLHNPSLFEVILPMTESAEEMIDIQEAFSEIANLKHKLYRLENDSLKHIEVIPLFEQVGTIMSSDAILKRYLQMHKMKFGFTPAYIRPYLARSDPALNSGLVPTVLAIKIALSRYRTLTKKEQIELFPIIGSATLPFRGGLSPLHIKKFAEEYRGIRTALLQSAFRYDFGKHSVIRGISELEQLLPLGEAAVISKQEEQELIEMIPIFERYYKKTVEGMADVINEVASQLPKRRERVQHIGLFGYSRGVGRVRLPRAIGFTGALYSLGIPPEMIGTGRGLRRAKKMGLLPLIEKYYIHLKSDLLQSGRFVNKDVLVKLVRKSSEVEEVLQDITGVEEYLGEELIPVSDSEKEHHYLVSHIYKMFKNKKPMTELIAESAILRKSIG